MFNKRKPVFLFLLYAHTAGAFILPGDYLVFTAGFVEPDYAGIWYMGGFAGGHLYLCEDKRTVDFESYVILDDDPETANYFAVYYNPSETVESVKILTEPTPGYAVVRVEPADVGRFNRDTSAREVKRLLPVKRAPRIFFAEPPPEYNEEINAAVSSIAGTEIVGYLNELQDFETRYSYTYGCSEAAKWIGETFDNYGLSVTLDKFFGANVDDISTIGSGDKCWVSGSDGKVFHTVDAGTTWDSADTGTTERLWSILLLDEFTGYAVGSGGTILRTADGETWTTEPPPVSYWIFGIDFADYENGCIVCDYGRILYTGDAGETWELAASPTDVRLYDVSFGTADVVWAVGRYGAIIKSNDKGLSWSSLESGTTTRLYGVDGLSEEEAWVVGWEGTVLHTVDGGVTWNLIDFGADTYFYCVDFVNKDVGYIAGSEGTVYKTADGGESWERLTTPAEVLYKGISFVDTEIGYIAGSNAIICTTDGEEFKDLSGNVDERWENLVGEKQGETKPDETVIVCAHYDSISDDPYNSAPGADDNASGIAVVLAAANALSGLSTERTIKFACFAGEEQGLLGSHHYANRLALAGEKVVAVVNLDMVAYDEEKGARDDTSLISNPASDWLALYYKSCGTLYNSGIIFDDFTDETLISSDHSSFWDVGYPAVFLIEGAVGENGTTEYPYYHTTEDTVDKLTVKLNTFNARAAAATIAHLAYYYEGDDDGPGDRLPPRVYPNPVRVASGETSVTFDRLQPESKISVYTLAGELVFETSVQGETLTWNLTARGGGRVASGVYLWMVKSNADTAAGKLAVIK
jgi:photosystem II stability/assembly factor-like uncharacterized protein